MKATDLSNELGLVSDAIVLEAENATNNHLNRHIKKALLLAVCLCLVFSMGMVAFGGKKIDLPSANGKVSAKYINYPLIDTLQHKLISGDLIDLTEVELFNCDTVIFYGVIENVKNIVINFNGYKEYRAIAKIRIEKVYRGDISSGTTISVLLNCPLDLWASSGDTEIISSFKKGTTGIFMPKAHDETSLLGYNNVTVCKNDLADYGFLDGERYAFLEMNNGLKFSRIAYKSISNATTIEDIERYILSMIKNN